MLVHHIALAVEAGTRASITVSSSRCGRTSRGMYHVTACSSSIGCIPCLLLLLLLKNRPVLLDLYIHLYDTRQRKAQIRQKHASLQHILLP